MSDELTNAIANLESSEVLKLVNEELERGVDPYQILEEGRAGMDIVGQRYASGDYFLPELVYSGEIFKRVSNLLKPKMEAGASSKKLGKIIIGTVEGDIHDIGKDIVVFMLDVSGFEVYDLGVDVPAQKFVDKIKETSSPVVGLSGFLTLAIESMKGTVDVIKSAGLRDKVKIMIGGGQMDEGVRKYAGADAYGKDAIAAISLAKQWLEGK